MVVVVVVVVVVIVVDSSSTWWCTKPQDLYVRSTIPLHIRFVEIRLDFLLRAVRGFNMVYRNM